MTNLVSVQAVPTYDDALLDLAVQKHFEALGVEKDLKPGMHVVLKPNLLAARAPEMGVTTHPAVLASIGRWLHAHGIERITLCDSPGGIYTAASQRKLYSVCGLDVLKPLMTLNEDVSYAEKNGFNIIKPILEADYIINVCKLKTHGLTTMTAGVKNLFGCIPGIQKPEWHCKRPNLPGFSEMLIDLCETVKPDITFVDAVIGMEGNGPGGGDKRHVGMTLCSRSPYQVDEACAKLMGIAPISAPVIAAARERGFSDGELSLCGDPLEPVSPPFTLPDAILGKEKFFSFNGIFHVFCGRGRTYPKVVKNNCIGCGKCAESCPMHLIEIKNRKAVIRRKGCISCFCCQEMCPAHAIEAKR